MIGNRARIDPSLISSTGLDDAAQTQFDKDKTKLLTSFYALFNKNLESGDAKNPLVDFVEQSDALFPQLTDHSQAFSILEKLLPSPHLGSKHFVIQKLNAWREAYF